MWELVFMIVLYAGYLWIFSQWYNERKKSLIIMCGASSLCYSGMIMLHQYVFSFSPLLIFMIASLVFVILGLIFHYSLDCLIVPLLMLLSIHSLIFPIRQLSSIITWQYTSYIIICLTSLFYVLLESKYLVIDQEWLRQFYLYDVNYKMVMIVSFVFYNILVYGLITILSFETIFQCLFIIMMIYLILGLLIKCLQVYLHLLYTLKVNEIMNQWQKESRDYMNVIRSQRHDFNFHLHAVVGLIENGEFEECRHYVTKMANEASLINDIMPIHDAVIGSMLYNMKEDAKKKGIDIEYNITYDLEHVLCNSFEINKIIGNLIQNAIDALTTQKEKEYGIKVSIFKRRGNSVIIVSNLFLGDKETILHAYDLGYSTKKHHEGIGLSMIHKTVEKYNGRIYTEFDEDVVSFIVNIPNLVCFEEGSK